jgi:hypothetical protein
MRRIHVSIDDLAFDALQQASAEARRRPIDHAGLLLEYALFHGISDSERPDPAFAVADGSHPGSER